MRVSKIGSFCVPVVNKVTTNKKMLDIFLLKKKLN